MKKLQYSPASTEENEDEVPAEFPEIDHIGLRTFGIYFILNMPLIISAARNFSYVFTTGKVSYRCLIPECEDPMNTTLHPVWLPNAVPYADGEPEICTRFTVQTSTDSCSTTTFTNKTESCDAWVYDPEEFTILNEIFTKMFSSLFKHRIDLTHPYTYVVQRPRYSDRVNIMFCVRMIQNWDLTCDNNLWKLTLPGTMHSVGQFIGLVIFGHLSDKYGRRNLIALCTTISSIFGIIRSFSIGYEMFVVFEFLDALAGSAIFGAIIVLGMELVGPKKRIQASSFTCSLYVVYAMFLGPLAKWLKSWRSFLRVLYTPGLLAIFMLYIIPDSVRWLQSKGRLEEAEAVLRKIAVRNKIRVTETSIRMIRNSKSKIIDKKSTRYRPPISPVKEIICNRTILLRLMSCAFCWVANVFVYYGLSLRSITLPGDKYINFALVISVGIPANFTSWILTSYVGRRLTLSISYFLSGIFCIVTIFVPTDWWYLPLIVFLGGKFCISVAYQVILVVTAEMFPTQLRHSLLGFCSMIGCIGSMLAPQMPLLAKYMPSLPLLLFGLVAITASLLSLSFPETFGVRLPDTVSEAENIGKVKKVDQHLELPVNE